MTYIVSGGALNSTHSLRINVTEVHYSTQTRYWSFDRLSSCIGRMREQQ